MSSPNSGIETKRTLKEIINDKKIVISALRQLKQDIPLMMRDKILDEINLKSLDKYIDPKDPIDLGPLVEKIVEGKKSQLIQLKNDLLAGTEVNGIKIDGIQNKHEISAFINDLITVEISNLYFYANTNIQALVEISNSAYAEKAKVEPSKKDILVSKLDKLIEEGHFTYEPYSLEQTTADKFQDLKLHPNEMDLNKIYIMIDKNFNKLRYLLRTPNGGLASKEEKKDSKIKNKSIEIGLIDLKTVTSRKKFSWHSGLNPQGLVAEEYILKYLQKDKQDKVIDQILFSLDTINEEDMYRDIQSNAVSNVVEELGTEIYVFNENMGKLIEETKIKHPDTHSSLDMGMRDLTMAIEKLSKPIEEQEKFSLLNSTLTGSESEFQEALKRQIDDKKDNLPNLIYVLREANPDQYSFKSKLDPTDISTLGKTSLMVEYDKNKDNPMLHCFKVEDGKRKKISSVVIKKRRISESQTLENLLPKSADKTTDMASFLENNAEAKKAVIKALSENGGIPASELYRVRRSETKSLKFKKITEDDYTLSGTELHNLKESISDQELDKFVEVSPADKNNQAYHRADVLYKRGKIQNRTLKFLKALQSVNDIFNRVAPLDKKLIKKIFFGCLVIAFLAAIPLAGHALLGLALSAVIAKFLLSTVLITGIVGTLGSLGKKVGAWMSQFSKYSMDKQNRSEKLSGERKNLLARAKDYKKTGDEVVRLATDIERRCREGNKVLELLGNVYANLMRQKVNAIVMPESSALTGSVARSRNVTLYTTSDGRATLTPQGSPSSRVTLLNRGSLTTPLHKLLNDFGNKESPNESIASRNSGSFFSAMSSLFYTARGSSRNTITPGGTIIGQTRRPTITASTLGNEYNPDVRIKGPDDKNPDQRRDSSDDFDQSQASTKGSKAGSNADEYLPLSNTPPEMKKVSNQPQQEEESPSSPSSYSF